MTNPNPVAPLTDLLDAGVGEGHGAWRPNALYTEEGFKRRQVTVWLTDDDDCDLALSEGDVATLVAAARATSTPAGLQEAAERVVEEYDISHLPHDVAYEDLALVIDALRAALQGADR